METDSRQNGLVEKVFDAAARDDWEKVKQLIESGGVPSAIERGFGIERHTIAHIAAKKGNLDMLKYLLEADSSILNKNVENPIATADPLTLLETAVVHGHLNIVKYLVESHNEDIFRERAVLMHDNCSPVTWAIINNHLNIVKYFIEERHMDVNTGYQSSKVDESLCGPPLLFQAVEYHRHNITNYLVNEKKANLTMLDKNDRNVLFVGTYEDDLPFMKHVLDEKKANIDINWKDVYGKTILYVAVEDNNQDILRYLVEEKQADVNIAEKEKNWTPLHQSVYSHFEVFQYLIEHGANLETRDKNGATPLHLAAAEKFYYKKCQYLLERGANLKQKNNKGETPLDLAIANNNRNASEYLVEHRGDVNQRNEKGETLLHSVAAHNQIEFLDYLVSKKHADVNVARNRDKWTPLHCAASWDHEEICKYLIEHGADPQAQDRDGISPAQVASKEEVINYLQNASATLRSRRSVGHSIWLRPNHPRPNNSLTYHQVIEDAYKRAPSYFTNDIQPFQFQNILVFANFLIRYLVPSVSRSRIEERNLSSNGGILQKGGDFVAEDAIHTFLNFGEEEV